MAGFPSVLAGTGTAYRPSIILVHGAWHRPSCWGKITEELQGAQYKNVVVVDLPSVGQVVGRDADVAVVVSALEEELSAGRDVLLVAHSYGGAVISEAVKDFKNRSSEQSTVVSRVAEDIAGFFNRRTRQGRICGLVYLASYLPLISDVDGTSPKPDVRSTSPKYVRFDGDRVFPDGDLQNNPPEKVFYNDLPPHEANFWTKQLLFSSYDALNAKPSKTTPKQRILSQSCSCLSLSIITYNETYTDVYPPSAYIPYTGDFKCTFVLCSEDNALPVAWSQHYLFQSGALFETEKIHSGHSPMLSQPKKVAEIIRRAACERGI